MRMTVALVLGLALFAGNAHAAGLEGRKAPAVALKDQEGQPQTLIALAEGRPTVVLFWASWCPYCKALMPKLDKLLSDYGSDRVRVVAIDTWEEDKAEALAVIRDGGFHFKFLLKGDKDTKKWGVKGTPGLFIVDRTGVVVYDRNARPFKPAAATAGATPDTSPARSAELWIVDVRKIIDQQLALPPPIVN